jgi:hypothetical protein
MRRKRDKKRRAGGRLRDKRKYTRGGVLRSLPSIGCSFLFATLLLSLSQYLLFLSSLFSFHLPPPPLSLT